MPAAESPELTNPGLLRFSGMYGSAWRNGSICADVHEVTGATEINRIDVPLVGYTRNGYKPGREAREGTLRIQKMDSKWELEVYRYLASRSSGGHMKPFQLVLQYDDPDALGKEQWQLNGVLLWRLPFGFSITDDLVDREIPFTWEAEQPLYAFEAQPASSGMPKPVWNQGNAPASGLAATR